eukprot:UN21669
MVLAATNLPWTLDEALKRRLEKRIYIPLPDEKAREALFKLFLKEIQLRDDVDFTELAKLTKGYSGADVNSVCRDASMMSMRNVVKNLGTDDIKKLKVEDMATPLTRDEFLRAIKNTKPSVEEKTWKNSKNGWLNLALYELKVFTPLLR